MFRIRRFGVIRTANVVAFLYVVIIAVIFVPIGLIVAIAVPSSGLSGNAGAFVGNAGGLAIVFIGLLLALFYGIVGWIVTAIGCLLYNFAAGMIGGIEIQLEAVQPPSPAVVWGQSSPPPPAPGAAASSASGGEVTVPPSEPPAAAPPAP